MQMIIANTLSDGFVVFLAEEGWTADIAAGAVAADDDEAAALLERAKLDEQNNVVIDPYLIPVEISAGERVPVEYREFIRATGNLMHVEIGAVWLECRFGAVRRELADRVEDHIISLTARGKIFLGVVNHLIRAQCTHKV